MNNLSKQIDWLLKEKYHGQSNKKFLRDVDRLKAGEPLDYVIGFTEFLGCKIDLTCRPLIPRFETEFWVNEMLPHVKSNTRILDIFSGSGCIGLAMLTKIKNSQVVFAEKNDRALAQIKKNIKINHRDKKRFWIIKSDIFSRVNGRFDYIFANPPYIPINRRLKIQKSVLKYEPREALFGGQDGIKYIKKFLKQAPNFLITGGKIYLEFDSPQKKSIEKLLKKYQYRKWQFGRDQYKKWRYVIIE